MIWLPFFLIAAALVGWGAWAAASTLYDFTRARSKLVAPWRDADPQENKARTKVWFP